MLREQLRKIEFNIDIQNLKFYWNVIIFNVSKNYTFSQWDILFLKYLEEN